MKTEYVYKNEKDCKSEYKNIIESLTLEEKVGLLSGRDVWSTKPIKRLGIPEIYLSDGPNGVRKQIGDADHLGINKSLPATCFPSLSTMANSWDEVLLEQLGEKIGEEAKAFNVNVLLGPGINIKRSPLCGRNFEYFSEDPYLSGKMAAAYIRGVQNKGVSACPKHFAVNSQENKRMTIDSIVDERTLREIYLTGFEIAVKEGKPWTIMTSYNKVNGVYANENSHLLKDILRNEWEYEGVVVTDWGGSNDHVAGVKAGSSLEMPGTAGDSDRQLRKAVKNKRISEDIINDRAEEVLRLIYNTKTTGRLVAPGKDIVQRKIEQEVKISKRNEYHLSKKNLHMEEFDVQEHHEFARKALEQSIVLLKNENNILPLKKKTKTVIIGEFAEKPRIQGAGSSLVNAIKTETTLDIINKYSINFCGYAKGFKRDGRSNKKLIEEACRVAKNVDVVIYYMGLPESFESEGKDREHMKLPLNQTELLKKISEVNTNIVVVLSAGSVVEMQWTDYCKGLVLSGLGGQAQAEAVLKVLTGQVNPGGKLSETYPYVYEDVPVIEYWQKKPYKSEYREGIYVGYRYYESAGIEVKFPFGYGLSYTQFTYSNLIVTKKGVMITVENTGGREGSEVIQLYVRKKSKNLFSPIKELKGFKKIFLNAGENQKVKIGFDDKTFRHFDEKKGVWQTESGIWNIMIGSSVRDIELRSEVFINFSKGNITEIKQLNKKGELEKYTTTEESEKVLNLSSYYSANIKNVADDEFKELMMYTDVYKTQNKGDSLEINDPLSDLVKARSRIARLTGKAIKKCKERSERKNPPDLNILFIYNIPFRGIAKLMNGNISMEMTEAILEIVNGYFCKGIKDFIKGAILNRKNKKQYYKGGLYEEK